MSEYTQGKYELKTPTMLVIGRRLVANTAGYTDSNNSEACQLESEANATHIVKCVNSHQALVDALEECDKLFMGGEDTVDWYFASEMQKQIEAALKLAKGDATRNSTLNR